MRQPIIILHIYTLSPHILLPPWANKTHTSFSLQNGNRPNTRLITFARQPVLLCALTAPILGRPSYSGNPYRYSPSASPSGRRCTVIVLILILSLPLFPVTMRGLHLGNAHQTGSRNQITMYSFSSSSISNLHHLASFHRCHFYHLSRCRVIFAFSLFPVNPPL